MKIKDFIAKDGWFGKDKLLHFAACLIATILVDYETAMIGGTVKEFIDIFTTGFSYKDLVWDYLGTFCGVLIKGVFGI